MDNATTGARHPKACMTCAKAKVRCLPEPNGPCKRCHRLGKECGNQTPGAHRRQQTPGPKSSDVAALEAKLDRMVAMLAQSASGQSAREQRGDLDETRTRISPPRPHEQTAAPRDVNDEEVLEIFTKQMLPLFPFLMIPSHVTAEELRREKPFLFLNISLVACLDSSRQKEIVKTIQRYVADHIIIRGEHSLDLLQGLLVNVVWHTPVRRCQITPLPGSADGHEDMFKAEAEPQHVGRSSAQLDAFVHLLVAQSLSLGLNQDLAYQKNLNYPLTYLFAKENSRGSDHPVRTLEERRAYLGCYYLTTMLSTCVKDLGSIVRFTRYTEECCKVLDQAAEYPIDAYLVQLVRAMNLGDRIHQTLYRNELHSSSVSSHPVGLSIRWFEAELKQLKARMPYEPPHGALLLTHFDTLEIHLYRVALNHDSAESNYGDHPMMRLDLLFRCLEALSSFFRNFYTLPSTYFPYIPFTIICQFGKAVVTLSQLLLYNHDGWDRAYVESTIDFNHTIDQMIAKLEESRPYFQRTLEQDPDSTKIPEIFGRMAARAKMLKAMHQRRKEALEQTSPPSTMEVMDYELMMNTPLDLLFPFGETPPVYQPDSFLI